MIKTFIIDWPVLVFFGFLFGGTSSRVGAFRALFAGAIPTGGLAASAMLSYKVAPDWMWMYYRDPDDMDALARVMPVGYAAAFLAAFLSALKMDRSSSRRARALALGAEVAVVAATWDRCHRIGTKEDWETGKADELLAVKPEGKAKEVGSYLPLVVGTFVVGAVLAWGGRASPSRR